MLSKFLLFAALFALVAWSSAFSFDDLHIDGIEAYLHHGEKRQASGTANTPTPPPVSSSVRPPVSSAPQSPPVSTPADPTSQAPTLDPPRSSAPQQSAPVQTSPASNQPSSPRSSAAVQPSSARPTTAARTTAVVWTSALVSTSMQEFVTVITTISDGQQAIITSTGTNTIPITTGQVVVTDAPSSQNSNENNRGLSKTDKNIIGGVVGGVGGALLLGGIALVFLRMKKRQTRVHEDDDDMTLGTGSALGDKTTAGNGATPFQSNLEQYHNPSGRPNAAANF